MSASQGYNYFADPPLTMDVIISIRRVLDIPSGPTSDPLDIMLADFNPVETLNKLFPNEASLCDVEKVQTHLKEDYHALEAEIVSLREELRNQQDPNHLQLIQSMISELMGQMSLIREKATESEAVVRDITKDIQLLDMAKKNMILSMTTLRRFQMLFKALKQLEEFVGKEDYGDVAQSLAAVKELSSSFKPYLSVPRVAQVWARIQSIQGILRSKLEKVFDKFLHPEHTKSINIAVVSSACVVADVIGDDFQTYLINKICTQELKEYRRIFRATDEAGQLDNISRRFAFFRRLIQSFDNERGRAFPVEWKAGHHLCSTFIGITRDDVAIVLGRAASTVTVTTLLEALQQVLDFESYLSKKYNIPLSDLLKLTSGSTGRPSKSISSAFEPHMGIFIEAQNKALADMLAPHRGPKSRTSLEVTAPSASTDNTGPAIVLPSSTELFYFYAQSLEKCSTFSIGKPLHDLALLHKKWLKIYADDVLVSSLKRPISQARRSADVRYDVGELKNACLIVNTADYCQATALELEINIKDKIDPEYKDNVSLQPERELFINAVSLAIMAMLKELEAACEGAFMTMIRTSWAAIENVSGPSAFIAELSRNIDELADVVRPLIDQKKYLRNFYDKAAALIISRFTTSLVKSRPLKEVGAEQVWLTPADRVRQHVYAAHPAALGPEHVDDVLAEIAWGVFEHNNVSYLYQTANTDSNLYAFHSHAKSVLKVTTRLEKLLKVIIIPSDPPEDFVLNYTLLIGDTSFSNFQKVLDLKGTPRTEQNHLLDTFVTVTSTKTDLESTSFLSSLDMDPPMGGQLASLASPAVIRTSSLLLGGTGTLPSATDGIFTALSSPPGSGPTTGVDTSTKTGDAAQKREVFSDFRRFVSFGLRRDTTS